MIARATSRLSKRLRMPSRKSKTRTPRYLVQLSPRAQMTFRRSSESARKRSSQKTTSSSMAITKKVDSQAPKSQFNTSLKSTYQTSRSSVTARIEAELSSMGLKTALNQELSRPMTTDLTNLAKKMVESET